MSDDTPKTPIKLTHYSHGAGCGCKLSPAILDQILAHSTQGPGTGALKNLLVGNSARDDAAAYALEEEGGQVLLSTTDFFMPIVDDPFEFGRIAAANAISDIYAMGGRPILALALLGWPVDKLPPEVAGQVLEGARATCAEAGIALAGGHSIDSPEPIFGLAVNGLVARENLMENGGAKPGDLLWLTKPLGVGILSTAQKKGLLREEDEGVAAASMMRLNTIGALASHLPGVHAMTDVTGFGLLGHLSEMCAASELAATLHMEAILTLSDLPHYIEAGAIPGGTGRNWESYGHRVGPLSQEQKLILCDPQTSGGLLIAASRDAAKELQALFTDHGLWAHLDPVGELTSREGLFREEEDVPTTACIKILQSPEAQLHPAETQA